MFWVCVAFDVWLLLRVFTCVLRWVIVCCVIVCWLFCCLLCIVIVNSVVDGAITLSLFVSFCVLCFRSVVLATSILCVAGLFTGLFAWCVYVG